MNPIIITYIYLLIFSYHTDYTPKCNQNNNPVIGIEFQHRYDRYLLLTLPNSRNNQAVVFARKENWFFYGVSTGYDYPLTPFIAPMITISHGDFSSEISCLSNTMDVACVFSLKYKL